MEEHKIEDYLPHKHDLIDLHDRAREFIEANGQSPRPGSEAAKELSEYPRPDLVTDTYAMAIFASESATEHMIGFTRLMVFPLMAIAPWTVVRGLVEASALSSWLLEPSIGPKERVGRRFACCYDSMEKNRKLAELFGWSDKAKDVIESTKSLEDEAIGLSFPRLTDRRGKRNGIGVRLPSKTELIKWSFGDAAIYNILSGMAHAQPHSLRELAYEKTGVMNVDGREYLKKGVSPDALASLCSWSMRGVIKPVWFLCKLYGLDEKGLAEILDHVTRNVVREENRCWEQRVGTPRMKAAATVTTGSTTKATVDHQPEGQPKVNHT